MAYDYLIVGAGLFGSTLAHCLLPAKVLVIERMPEIGGFCRTEVRHGITIHCCGPHVLHTPQQALWDWVHAHARLKPFHFVVKARAGSHIYTLPFSLQTLYEFYGVTTPEQAQDILEHVRVPCNDPANLEELALALVGPAIYETLIRDYTYKQWGAEPRDLPPTLLRRLPFRFTWDTRYHTDPWAGVPYNGYSGLIARLLERAEVRTSTPYEPSLQKLAKTVIYTGPLDELYQYCLGRLEYRGLRFEHAVLDRADYQGTAVMNYCGPEPHTRITEHKHFLGERLTAAPTVITHEYPDAAGAPCYPVELARNQALHQRYRDLAIRDGLLIGGRLGLYKYIDMHTAIEMARSLGRVLHRGGTDCPVCRSLPTLT